MKKLLNNPKILLNNPKILLIISIILLVISFISNFNTYNIIGSLLDFATSGCLILFLYYIFIFSKRNIIQKTLIWD